MGRFDGRTCKLIVVMGMVVVYFFIELVVGYFIQSLALMADAFHMLSDFIALIVGIVSQRLTKMPRTSRNTFGWQRADVVGSLINTVILCTLCFTIFMRAIERFIEVHEVHKPYVMVAVGSGGLVLNIVSLLVLGHHGHSHAGVPVAAIDDSPPPAYTAIPISDPPAYDEDAEPTPTHPSPVIVQVDCSNPSPDAAPTTTTTTNTDDGTQDSPIADPVVVAQNKCNKHANVESQNIKAVMQHVLADALGSVIVVVCSLVICLAPENSPVKKYIDPAMSIILVIIIVSTTAKLLYQNALILLQSVPNTIEYGKLKSELETVSGGNMLHDLHIWRLQSQCIIGTVHIRFRNVEEYLSNCKNIKNVFHNSGVHCTTIQPEFDEQDNQSLGTTRCLLDCGTQQNCDPTSCCPTNTPSPDLGDRTSIHHQEQSTGQKLD